MGWKDLLQKDDERFVSPWLGGRSVRDGGRILRDEERSWTIDGKLPREQGWYSFRLQGRVATLVEPVSSGTLRHLVRGYLVGDRLVVDDARVDPEPKRIAEFSEPVALIEPGLDRFVRIRAGRMYKDGPLVYEGLEFPLGPEEAVLQAYLDEKPTVADVKGVNPALDAAFRMETWQRIEAERRRVELERRRREEEEKRRREEERAQLVSRLGDGASRRAMATIDFAEAARAALAIGGAAYLDHRASVRRGEMVVRFRFADRRFECVCDSQTLAIIDSGICLTAHDDEHGFEEGTKGDSLFTLESLPAVIREAIDDDKLVVYRHVR